MTLTKFQDNFLAKTFNKHRDGVKIMEFLKSVITLFGWGLPFLGSDQPILDSEFCLSGVDPPWVQADLQGLSIEALFFIPLLNLAKNSFRDLI